ncbi:MAG TPA: kelch repeat-containing protein [Bacteroidia bacterium]|nr:kelch repeat-containing protein [Bacteroidia bacterium]
MRRLLFLIFFLLFTSSFITLKAQNTWLKKTNYGGGGRDDASGFAIGNTGYILSGTDTGGYFTDMWAWNSQSDAWTQVASYPGGKRIGTKSVSFNGFGYVLGGEEPASCYGPYKTRGAVCNGTFYRDIWRYDPDSNSWLRIDTFPGLARDFAVAVMDPNDSTIYYGTGNDNDTGYLSDWWSYYIPGHTWTQLADFGGGQRNNAVGFCVNGIIYVGTGDDNDMANYASSDFWQYTPATNSWKRVSDIPGLPLRNASGFAIDSFGYVCLGISDTSYTANGWRYNPATDTWAPIANFGGDIMADGVAFTIGNNGYIGTGSHNGNDLSQFWEYTLDSTLGAPVATSATAIHLYPNPAKGTINVSYTGVTGFPALLKITDAAGNLVGTYTITNNTGQALIDVTGLAPGAYFYRLSGYGIQTNTGKFIITR